MILVDSVLAYLHYLSIIVIAGCLSCEFLLLRSGSEPRTIEELGWADMGYFFAAGVVLLTGFTRFLISAKGLDYYAGNSLFWIKLALFFTLAAISIVPTRRYSRWRHLAHMDHGYRIPQQEAHSTRYFVLVELSLVVVLPLIAVLMARGIGI